MFYEIAKPLFFLFFLLKLASSVDSDFTLNGFNTSNLKLDGSALIRTNGLLQLTNDTFSKGHAFHPSPLHFLSKTTRKSLSFSTTFVFAILPEVSYLGGNGIAFVISPTNNLSSAQTSQYMGLFNATNNGNSANHIFAIELDTVQNPEFNDINDNHVGIDLNGLFSNKSSPVGFYDDASGSFNNVSLINTQPIQVWIDYNGTDMKLDVTVSLVPMPKPKKPLLSAILDLSTILRDTMYVGVSSSTGAFRTSHYIQGWSFSMNGAAKALDYSNLPSLPVTKTKNNTVLLAISLPIAVTVLLILTSVAIVLVVRTRKDYTELLEDWESEYGPHRFSYKELYKATKGFQDNGLLGTGGFGRVYKGTLPTTKMKVAVKKISHESRQGMKEFVAEIVSIGKLRHRNLVQLLGYCRRKGELLLVYEYMSNGSLDRYLYYQDSPTLNWSQRFTIVKGIASGLLYLHEDWEQLVVHRDIKASNVMLDEGYNGKLGDFGLSRLYDHGTDPYTTHVVGTTGYLAPELARTGKATTATDVFAFGTFLLEVVCGRRPIEPHLIGEELMLVGWVLGKWQRGTLLEVVDTRIRGEYSVGEVELVLKLGLMCTNPRAGNRPRMREVVKYLEGELKLPELPVVYSRFTVPTTVRSFGLNFNDSSTSVSDISSLSLSGGR